MTAAKTLIRGECCQKSILSNRNHKALCEWASGKDALMGLKEGPGGPGRAAVDELALPGARVLEAGRTGRPASACPAGLTRTPPLRGCGRKTSGPEYNNYSRPQVPEFPQTKVKTKTNKSRGRERLLLLSLALSAKQQLRIQRLLH